MIIGVTGSMSAGKSTVSHLIQDQGLPVYDTDKMVHHYYKKEDGPLYKEIISLFGKDILDSKKEIDRKKLAEIIFNDDKELDALEALVFPRVLEEMKTIVGNRQSLIFFEVPLLFEAKMESFFDKIIVVDAEKELRVERALSKGHEFFDLEKRMSRQWSPLEKRKKADYIIENNTGLNDLKEEVEDVLEIIKLERSRLWIKK